MSTSYVVDASVALKWFFDEEASDRADALAGSGAALLAPAIVTTELANAFRKQHRRGIVGVEAARAMLADAPRYFSELAPLDPLLQPAFDLATAHDHPVYDCLYLALAEQRSAPLVTADGRLIRRFAGTALEPRILSIAGFPA